MSAEIRTLPGCHVLSGYARGRCLASDPNCTCAIELIARNNPIVTMTSTRGDACSTGRITTRSMPAPSTNEIAIDTTIATHTESPRSAKYHVRYVEYSAISPCAKFRMPVVLKINTSARASDAYTAPLPIPFITWVRNSDTPQTPRYARWTSSFCARSSADPSTTILPVSST